jgi:hypothetical protein
LASFGVEDRLQLPTDGNRVVEALADGDHAPYAHAAKPPGTPGPMLVRPTYFYKIDGADRPVVEVCAEYMNALRKMVQDFQADHP